MPGIMVPIGMPGPGTVVAAAHRHVFRGLWEHMLPGGKTIDGASSRDPGNTGYLGTLRPGMFMGKITATGLYAPSVYGLTNGALTSTGTTVTLASAAIGTEIVRRKGATGTVKISGPPGAAGVVRAMTATYSAISGTSMTISALGVNEVQTVTMNIASTGGTLTLRVPKADGTFAITTPITWDATDATYLASINTALDVATGVTGGIVATGTPDTVITLTFSGVGYAGLPQPTEMVSVEGTLPTSTTAYSVARTTTGANGAFVTGSLIQPVDGSETILTFIPDGYGIQVTDDQGASVTVPFPLMPIAGMVETAQLINYPADASSKAYIKAALAAASCRFTYDDAF